jgi:hypothetical protein
MSFLTKAEFEALAAKASADPQPLIEQAFAIQTKQLPGQSPVELLTFNRAQRRLHTALQRQRHAGKPQRGIVLKARQPGISTYASARVAATGLCQPYANAMQIAQEESATIGLFRKIQFIYEMLPEGLRPRFGVDRRDELLLEAMPCQDGEAPLHTTVAVATAGGATEPWRSRTLQVLHLSEFAWMPRASEILLGALSCVPTAPNTLALIESTANGIGNDFHQEWMRAEAGESEFTPVFIGWWEIDEYQLPVADDFEPTDDEREMAQRHGLTHEQLAWWRYMLHTVCRGNRDLMSQEFPATPDEAFLLSGRPAFNVKKLRDMLIHVRPHRPLEGFITLEGGFSAMAGGPLRVFKKPVEGHEYTIAADPSAGVSGGDPACVQVFDRHTNEFVAVWHGWMEPAPLGRVCVALGRWYNHAIFAPELNAGHGMELLREVKNLRYEALYVWTREDKIRRTVSNFYGWETSYKTKQWLIDTMAHAVNEDEILVFDPLTIQELIEFQYFDGKRAEGSGVHDDRAMAAMIAYRIHVESPLQANDGMPPKVKHEEAAQAQADEVPMPAGSMNKDAWTEADEVLQGLQSRRVIDQIVQPNPDELHGHDDQPGFVVDFPW